MKEKDEKIVAEWLIFSRTEAYKDWVKSMEQAMGMIQKDVDNMTTVVRTPTGPTEVPLSMEKSSLMNQRRVGIKFALEYAQLRIDSAK